MKTLEEAKNLFKISPLKLPQEWICPVLASLTIQDQSSSMLISIAKVLEQRKIHPKFWRFAKNFFSPDSKFCPLDEILGENEEPRNKRSKIEHKNLLEACLTLVKISNFFHNLWKWPKLEKFLLENRQNLDKEEIWIIIQILKIVQQNSGHFEILQFMTQDEYDSIGLKYLQQQHQQQQQQQQHQQQSMTIPPLPPTLTRVNLIPLLTTKSANVNVKNSDFVELTSRSSQLNSVAINIAGGHPIILQVQ